MNFEEECYLNLLHHIIDFSTEKTDRTGIGTRSMFGARLQFSLKDGKLPLLTTKKMFARGIIEELLFFIRGETDTKKLEQKGVNIWKGNTSREFLDKRGLQHLPEGNMGPMYGFLWRNFNGVDQLKNVLSLIKNDPDNRRIIVTAYDPSLSNQCVLDPCHMFYQFYVNNGELSCQWYQRSVDCFLGLPFNIASYAVLTHCLANAAGLKAGNLIFVGGDTHVYNTHIKQVEEQITRSPFDFPTLQINQKLSSIEDIEKLSFEDFQIINYTSHPPIKAPMAV